MPRCLRFSIVALLGCLASQPAFSQVDLPDRGRSTGGRSTGGSTGGARAPERRGDVAPHLTCTACGERNYTTAIQWAAENGLQNAFCSNCRTERVHRIPDNKKKGSGRGVDFPTGRRGGDGGGTVEPGPAPGVRPPEPTPLAGVSEGELGRAASSILEEISALDSIDDARVELAPDTLIALGDAGISAARVALASDHGPLLMTGLRTLLRGGDARDVEYVARRIKVRMPTKVASLAVEEFVSIDPVHATPELLVELLAHAQSPVRQAAYRILSKEPGPELLPYLARSLEQRSSDTRRKAVDLLEQIDHPERLDLLIQAIDDPRASVARRAVAGVARIDDARVEPLLFEMAFNDRWILRSSAYALLTLVEREDAFLLPIFGAGHTDALLSGMRSSDEFVSAVCAAALAGIGFRSEAAEESDVAPEEEPGDTRDWIDRDVPARLVEVVAGFQFFNDYEAVRETAQRRLRMISGESYGSNGPAWAEWWLATRDEFRALRAVLNAPDGAERRLRLTVRDGVRDGAYVLLGPDEAPLGAPARDGEVFYLSEEEARDLLGALREQGALSVERLPGARGGLIERGRAFDVQIDGRAKSFAFGAGLGEPWFDRLMGVAGSMRERSLWQRFPDPERHGDRLGLYRAEGAWWSTHTGEDERRERLKTLVLQRMAAVDKNLRDDTLDALEAVYAEGTASADDLGVLLGSMADEPTLTGRARRLAALARQAAGLDPDVSNADDGSALSPEVAEQAGRIVDTLYEVFGEDALDEIGRTLLESGREATRDAASDPRDLIRVVSALTLATNPEEMDVGILLRMLEDTSIDVQVAAVEALGNARVEAAREALMVRASLSMPQVRSSALRAVGALGGDEVRDLLITTLTSGDVIYRLPAAEGLAVLADPSTASLMISLLRAESQGPIAEVLREGLLTLGEPAWRELFTAMRSPSPDLRREASLLLARQGVPGSVPGLIRALAEDPADARLGRELCILTCVNNLDAIDPAEAWYRWWDEVRHDDSLVWLLAAGEARSIAAPSAGAFVEDGAGRRDAVGFLAQMMAQEEDFVAERARRVLEDMVGRELGDLPPFGGARDAWIAALLEVLEEAQ